MKILWEDYDDPNALRKLAGEIKQHTLENLDRYLDQAVTALERQGAHVHFASTADVALEKVLEILKSHDASTVVKSTNGPDIIIVE